MIEYNRESRSQYMYISPFLQGTEADKIRSRGFGYIQMVKNVFDILEGDFQRFNRVRDWFQIWLVFVCAIDPGLRREIKTK